MTNRSKNSFLPPQKKDVLTTGDAAYLCGVSNYMIVKWIDTGLLPGYRLPGAMLHRRVRKEDLKAFLIHHEMPLGLLQESSS